MYNNLKQLLFKLDPESAHELAHGFLHAVQVLPFARDILGSFYSYPSSRLSQSLWGVSFPNPIGLAAGFDKNAKIPDAMSSLGFGFLELGSVTYKACKGNDKPRLFRLVEDEALINRMGLNNLGPHVFIDNYNKSKSSIPKLISISKTNDPSLHGDLAINDFCNCYRLVGSYSDVIVFNLSCPNTKDGKTFEDEEALANLLTNLNKIRIEENYKHSVLVKFSSDVQIDNLKKFLEIALKNNINGFVLCNTSNSREGLRASKDVVDRIGRGGLSGAPIYDKSLERVFESFKVVGNRAPIIGVGGVSSGNQAIKMIKAGASLVEIYTGLVYKGPGLIKEILEEIEFELSSSNKISLTELIGTAHS